jgi:hypothetical protein
MKMNYRLLGACACLALLTAAPLASAQTGPTRDASLGFIRDKMVAQGAITYSANLHDTATEQSWANSFTAEMSNVSVDVAACTISFHWKATLDGATQQDFDTAIPFPKLRTVSVVNREQEIRTQVASDHPSWVSTVSPAVWVVTMKSAASAYVLDFTDQDVAERVARAADHIMDLCGAPKAGF